MAGSTLVPPPPTPIAHSRAARVLPPCPSQLGVDVDASRIQLEAVDAVPLPPPVADAALDALSRPAPPIGRICRPAPPATPAHVDIVSLAAAAPARAFGPPVAAHDPLVDLPTAEDEADWEEAIARAKGLAATPAAKHRPAVPNVSRGMSDRMARIEALSTIAPALHGAVGDPRAGQSLEAVAPARLTPTRVGLLSGAASAVVIAAVHLLSSGAASATPEVAAHNAVRVIHAPAVVNESDDE